MNPYDWISLFYIVMKDKKKYEPIIMHLKMMIMCYILEIANMDVEITSVLKKEAHSEAGRTNKGHSEVEGGCYRKEAMEYSS